MCKEWYGNGVDYLRLLIFRSDKRSLGSNSFAIWFIGFPNRYPVKGSLKLICMSIRSKGVLRLVGCEGEGQKKKKGGELGED